MALKDYYDEAQPLDSFSWIAMPEQVRIHKLARLYCAEEDKIERRSRNYCGPTTGSVGMFIKSLYKPPRGSIGPTTKSVLVAVVAQKAKRALRARNPQWSYGERPTSHGQGHAAKRWLQSRMNRISERRFGITERQSYSDEPKIASHNCVGITSMGNCLVIVDGGSWGTLPRVYIRDRVTGDASVYVLDGDRCATVTDALTRMAPKNVLRRIFDGSTCRLTSEGGFDLNGKLIPFRGIRKVYTGEDIKATDGKPNKQVK